MPYPPPYVAILDVGHGNCTIIKDKESTFVIDCGTNCSGLLEFLQKEQINKITKLFISHSDQDHIGGLVGVLSSSKISIDEIKLNADATKHGKLWGDLIYELDALNQRNQTDFKVGISRSEEPIMCGQIELFITGPSPFLAAKGVGGRDFWGRTINSNSLSASFMINWGGTSIAYLAGDIDIIGLEDLCRINAGLKSQLLVFPHHGGKVGNVDPRGFTETLCERISPEIVIFSIGRNKFENPRPEIVATIKRRISNIRISCTQLSKNCAKTIGLKSSAHLVNIFSKGKEKFDCCSGTFVIGLGQKIGHFPTDKKHKEFIGKATHTPLCLT